MFRKAFLGMVALAAVSMLGPPPASAGTVDDGLTQLQMSATVVQPLAGDFTGDGAVDVLWYGSGSAPDALWENSLVTSGSTHPGDTFSVHAMPINGVYKPFVGDFDGNGFDDVFLYAPGSGNDSVWYFGPGRSVTSKGVTVNGRYTPRVGNFDTLDAATVELDAALTTEQDDVLWVPINSGAAQLWSGNTNKTFSTRSLPVPPVNARVLVGEFEASSPQPSPDVFFYRPGRYADSLWISDGDGSFTREAKTVGGQFQPFVGDFDAQGSRRATPEEAIPEYRSTGVSGADDDADACFLGDMAKCDHLHDNSHVDGMEAYHEYAQTCGDRRSVSHVDCVDAQASFDDDPEGLDDIVWYMPGTKPDRYWHNNGNGFTPSAITINGAAQPTVVPSTDAGGLAGGDRILWNRPGGADNVWVPSPGGPPFSSVAIADMGSDRRPIVGDFMREDLTVMGAGYHHNEVLWWARGNSATQKETVMVAPGGAWT